MAKKKAAVREDEPELIPFCALSDTTLDARDSRWPPAKVAAGLRWTLAGELPNFTRAALTDLLRKAFARISAVCGLTFAEAQGNANVIVTTGPIDGAGQVLAWSNLPPADPCEQRYDTGENWNQSVNLYPVLLHELGHAMGLQHDPARGALLSAYYDPQIQDYTSRDIQRLQALYGPPVSKPPPDDPPPVGGSKITVEITNADLIRFIDAQGRVAKVTWPV